MRFLGGCFSLLVATQILRDGGLFSVIPLLINCSSNSYLSMSLLYHTFANKSRHEPCIFLNDASPAAIWCICFANMMLLHFVPQWCDVCHKIWRSHASFAKRTSLGEANIICRRQTSFKKRTFVGEFIIPNLRKYIKQSLVYLQMMHRLGRYDAFALQIWCCSTSFRNDAMFAIKCGEATHH